MSPGPVEIALAVAVRDGRIFVARRPPGSVLGGLWEFPGGRIEPGEEPPEAARRELREETGLAAVAVEPLLVVDHGREGARLRLHVYLTREPEGEVRIDVPREWDWKTLGELESLEMPEANGPILRALRWRP